MTSVHIEKIQNYDKSLIKKWIASCWEKDNFYTELEGIETVLIKPNLLGAFEPEKAVTVHPIFLESLIEVLQSYGKKVQLGDSPGGNVPISKVWKESGVEDIANRYGVQLIRFGEKIRKIERDGFSFVFDDAFFQADLVIDVAKYKTHSMMLFTGAVKNLYGVVPGLLKSDYHKQCPTPDDFSTLLAALYSCLKPKVKYAFIDGILGMEGEGPSAGQARNFGVVFGGKIPSAIDYFAAKMMGFIPQDVALIRKSMRCDNISENDIEIDEQWTNFVFENVRIGVVSKRNKILNLAPKWVLNYFKRHFSYYPAFKKNCIACGICVRSCPMQIMTLNKGMKHPEIEYSKCIKCLCCHEMCPEHAMYLKKSWIAKLIFKS
jgi:uncharacterized protein (DUF362 family)/Pyruvate/2-oxoacid:ferredoxin oxidoreductase delta subunit